jgi:acetolactate synthase-1/2/3 large subunit
MEKLPSVGEALLRALAVRGVDALFANSGTDFPSVIEAYAGADAASLPRPVLCPHETVAVGMADGYARVSGRPQAVMVHVNVGAANGLAGLFNAAAEFVPMLFMAGRTPILEAGAPGARSLNIHWAQEMFDQGGMLREAVKWDYELRRAEQLAPVLDRALAIARSDPAGPVALMLPREVLADACHALPDPPALQPLSPAAPDAGAVDALASMLAAAERPMIVTASAGRDVALPPLLAAFAERFGVRVVSFRPRFNSLDTEHPLHGGFEVDPWLAESDAILVLECDVPWMPGSRAPRRDARIVHAGPDPLFGRYPVRGFRGEAFLPVRAAPLIVALSAAMPARPGHYAARGAAMAAANIALRQRLRAAAAEGGAPMSQAYATLQLDAALREAGEAPILVNEYPLVLPALTLREPGCFLGSSPVGGLGWGLPAALGAQMAAPDRLVVAALGDGSYVFANPVACHQVAAAEALPVLTILFDNGGYGAVKRATRAMYPQGSAAASGRIPLSDFAPVPDYVRVAESCGAFARRVTDAAVLPAALREAIGAARNGRQTLLSVAVA